jgi:hypothetical protein
MSILIAALVAAAPTPADLGPAWAEFSRAPALRLTRTKVEVGTLGFDRSRNQLDFWLRRAVTSGAKQQQEVTWADTRTCPSARPLLASMREIPVPKFAPIGSPNASPITLDGISYSLRTYSDEGVLTAQTNVNTHLASWIESALSKLERCWGSHIPERTR